MGKNPAVGIVFGLVAIGFAVFSLATRTEAPPEGYAILDYGLIAAGAIGVIGSLVAMAKQSAAQPSDKQLPP
jgi:hypothetical protein